MLHYRLFTWQQKVAVGGADGESVLSQTSFPKCKTEIESTDLNYTINQKNVSMIC